MFSIHQHVRKNSPILDNAGKDARNTKSQKISSKDWHWIKIRYGLSSKIAKPLKVSYIFNLCEFIHTAAV